MGEDILAKGTVRVAEAVRRYGIPRSNLYAMMETGRLSFSKVGRHRLIPVAAIEAMIREGMVGPEAKSAAA